MKTLGRRGFSFFHILIAIAVIGILMLAGNLVYKRQVQSKQSNYPYVFWIDNEKGGYKPSRTPPACPDPILTMSPADVFQATEVGYPGQYRGDHYKAHGLFSFYRNNSDDITVRLPFDASLISIVRYKETPQMDNQYIMVFQHECGFQVLFDHLHTLGPDFAEIDSTLTTQDNTGNKPRELPYGRYAAGTVVATGAGPKKSVKSGGFDFGLYDLRQPNEISKNPRWAELHENESGHTFYGVCWLDYLPAKDKKRVMEILPLYTDDRGASDYCDFAAGGSTLDYNNGLPVPDNGRPYQARD